MIDYLDVIRGTAPIDKLCPICGTQMLGFAGHEACPKCVKEQIQVEDHANGMKVINDKYRDFIKKASIFSDKSVLNDNFSNFKAEKNSPEAQALVFARAIAAFYYKNPNKGANVLMYGNAGAGKTHLAMSILRAVNDNTLRKTLFINASELMRRLKNHIEDKTTRWSQEYVIGLVRQANLVVLDDIGVESSRAGASQYVSETIYQIYESSKRIITTTNLNMQELRRVYTPRDISRMKEVGKGVELHNAIDFTQIADKRPDSNY